MDIVNTIRCGYCFLFRKLSGIAMYVTEACNSRCKNCLQWTTASPRHLSIACIERIVTDSASRFVSFGVQGGEFFMHPEWPKILDCFQRHRKFITDLNTNGLFVDETIQACRKYPEVIQNLAVSIDGIGARYKEIRGVDGFDGIATLIAAVKDVVTVRASYTISPLNSVKDYWEVKSFCSEKGIDVGIGIYNGVEYFKSRNAVVDLAGYEPSITNGWLRHYEKWAHGEYRMPCVYIRQSVVVLPSGEVSLCQGRNTIIGDLTKQTLSQVVESSVRLHALQEMKRCNGCYLACQRARDYYILKYFPFSRFM
jgi:MoaA/NifB/PqqE/SkfB family radical SAM enzyme